MAVIPKKNLWFGGVSAASYGIFISGEGVYSTPERAVEMVTIPGRNGALSIDQGRYENITIEYPALVHGRTQEEMRRKLSAFMNAVASQHGYQRLEDTYHQEEYRLAIYQAGIAVEPIVYGRAAKFTLQFNCKPQRFLKSGEEEVAVASGSAINNPTPFDSQPLLEIKGYGEMQIGDYPIDLNGYIIGRIQVYEEDGRQNVRHGAVSDIAYDMALNRMHDVSTGDPITVGSVRMLCWFDGYGPGDIQEWRSVKSRDEASVRAYGSSDASRLNIEIIEAIELCIRHYEEQGEAERYRSELEYLAIYHELLMSTCRIVQADPESAIPMKLLEDMDREFPDFRKNPYLSSMSKDTLPHVLYDSR